MKNQLRSLFLQRRKNLSFKRKKEASYKAYTYLKSIHLHTLSFFPLPSEINIQAFNQVLLEKDKLYLPKVHKNQLEIYKVSNLKDLKKSSLNIFEPCPSKCTQIDPSILEMILVPGIAFDALCFRLGFGKGFYDTFLQKYPDIPTLGIGFKEQFTQKLPQEPHDFQLKNLTLF